MTNRDVIPAFQYRKSCYQEDSDWFLQLNLMVSKNWFRGNRQMKWRKFKLHFRKNFLTLRTGNDATAELLNPYIYMFLLLESEEWWDTCFWIGIDKRIRLFFCIICFVSFLETWSKFKHIIQYLSHFLIFHARSALLFLPCSPPFLSFTPVLCLSALFL